jgi:hypothetical protein
LLAEEVKHVVGTIGRQSKLEQNTGIGLQSLAAKLGDAPDVPTAIESDSARESAIRALGVTAEVVNHRLCPLIGDFTELEKHATAKLTAARRCAIESLIVFGDQRRQRTRAIGAIGLRAKKS